VKLWSLVEVCLGPLLKGRFQECKEVHFISVLKSRGLLQDDDARAFASATILDVESNAALFEKLGRNTGSLPKGWESRLG
jgi:hypothetical protein